MSRECGHDGFEYDCMDCIDEAKKPAVLKRCALCDRPMPKDYEHVTCEACIESGKLQ